jgi:hypothetical protein
LVHGEVKEFFLQKLILPVLCTVLGGFRPFNTESIKIGVKAEKAEIRQKEY